jgi:hypothetical protein
MTTFGNNKRMWPFFTFYGGKWRAAPHYPLPVYDVIVEPFAGAAGYSVRHAHKKVILIEKDPVIAALWRWLIASTPETIRALPMIAMNQTVMDLDVPTEARSLIGFWLNKGCASPCKSPGSWMRGGLRPKSFWGTEIRERIALQVGQISHWEVIEGDYTDAPDIESTWFIDPPYQSAGRLYRYSSCDIDYGSLAKWCQLRRGQKIVCENEGATWLPFRAFLEIKSTEGCHGKGKSREAIWP